MQPGLWPLIGRPRQPGTIPPAATSAAIRRGVGDRHPDTTRGERLAASGTSATSAGLSSTVSPCWYDCNKSLPRRNFLGTGLPRLASHAGNVAGGSLAA